MTERAGVSLYSAILAKGAPPSADSKPNTALMNLKKSLRDLLVQYPEGVTLSKARRSCSLLLDSEVLNGYSSVRHLLASMPDVVKLQGYGVQTFLLPTDTNLYHRMSLEGSRYLQRLYIPKNVTTVACKYANDDLSNLAWMFTDSSSTKNTQIFHKCFNTNSYHWENGNKMNVNTQICIVGFAKHVVFKSLKTTFIFFVCDPANQEIKV